MAKNTLFSKTAYLLTIMPTENGNRQCMSICSLSSSLFFEEVLESCSLKNFSHYFTQQDKISEKLWPFFSEIQLLSHFIFPDKGSPSQKEPASKNSAFLYNAYSALLSPKSDQY